MSGALYLPPEKWEFPAEIRGDELRHLAALRLKPGDSVRLLDGQGRIAACVIEALSRKRAVIQAENIEEFPEPEAKAVIAIAISKASRRGFFLEKAAELGAWEIWIWRAERSQGKISGDLLESCRAKLLAGCKQSENPWLPQVRGFNNAEETAKTGMECDWRFMPWENEQGLPMLEHQQLGKAGSTIFAIGPEGGITEEEAEIFTNAGFMSVSLGSRILRCETAATLCLGLQWWGAQLRERGKIA